MLVGAEEIGVVVGLVVGKASGPEVGSKVGSSDGDFVGDKDFGPSWHPHCCSAKGARKGQKVGLMKPSRPSRAV